MKAFIIGVALAALLVAGKATAVPVPVPAESVPAHAVHYVPGHGEPLYWNATNVILGSRPPLARMLVSWLTQNSEGSGAPGTGPVLHCHFPESGRGIQLLQGDSCPLILLGGNGGGGPVVIGPRPSPIPLPASLPLLALALAGLWTVRRPSS